MVAGSDRIIFIYSNCSYFFNSFHQLPADMQILIIRVDQQIVEKGNHIPIVKPADKPDKFIPVPGGDHLGGLLHGRFQALRVLSRFPAHG